MSAVGWLRNYLQQVENTEIRRARRRRHRGRLYELEYEMSLQEQQQHLDELRDQLEQLRLTVDTLTWALVRNGTISETELVEQAQEIDRLDGQADGRLHGSIQPDGKIVPAAVPEPTALDKLTDAQES